MDGLEVLAWLYTRPDLSWIAVVMLSSSDLESDIYAARQLHADDFCVKPRQPEDWSKLLQSLSDRWLG